MTDAERISLIEFGQLKTRVEVLQTQVSSMQKDVKVMRDLMEQGKGGWRTLVFLGGMTATFGSFVAWALSHVPKIS